MTDAVNPDHYTRFRVTFEPADLTALLPHPLASAIEYIIRAPFKGREVEDLKKAQWWLRKLLDTEPLWLRLTGADPVLKLPCDDSLAAGSYTYAAYTALQLNAPILRYLWMNERGLIRRSSIETLVGVVSDSIGRLEAQQGSISHDTAMQEGEE